MPAVQRWDRFRVGFWEVRKRVKEEDPEDCQKRSHNEGNVKVAVKTNAVKRNQSLGAYIREREERVKEEGLEDGQERSQYEGNVKVGPLLKPMQ